MEARKATPETVRDDIIQRYEGLTLRNESTLINPKQDPFHLLSYYPDAHKDGFMISFEGFLSSPEKLSDAIDGHATILNCEVAMSDETATALVVKRADEDSNLFLVQDWIQLMLSCNRKGMQIKLSSRKTLEGVTRLLKYMQTHFKPPIIVRADILRLEGAPSPEILVHDFLCLMTKLDSRHIICLGWQANIPLMAKLKTGYTIDDLLMVGSYIDAYNLTQPILLSVHATLVKHSLDNLRVLLHMYPKLSLCVESSHPDNPVDLFDFIQMRNSLEHDRVFYDIPSPELEHMFNRPDIPQRIRDSLS